MALEFTDLLKDTNPDARPALLDKIGRGICRAVERSFREDGSRRTMSEVRRRGQICVEKFRELRAAPFTWSVERILDNLGRALRHVLDGTEWDPEGARASWAPPAD